MGRHIGVKCLNHGCCHSFVYVRVYLCVGTFVTMACLDVDAWPPEATQLFSYNCNSSGGGDGKKLCQLPPARLNVCICAYLHVGIVYLRTCS